MTTKAQILSAMQYSSFNLLDPMNGTGDARYRITYQFASTAAPSDFPSSTAYSGWTAFSAAEMTAVRNALDYIETFLNVDFVQVSGSADPDVNLGKVTLAGSTAGQGGYSISYSGSSIMGWDGFAVFDNLLDLSQHAQLDLILHEIGHALGLKHPFSGDSVLPSAEDSNKYTVMSYDANPDNGEDSDAMMLYDVFALQDIWGAAAHATGNTTYRGPRTQTVDSIWDTGGIDTFDASARSASVRLDLREGAFSTFGTTADVVITYGTRIEKALGGLGADRLIGNTSANTLKGGKGADHITGGAGADMLAGNQGADRLYGQNQADRLFGGLGNDQLFGGNGRDLLSGGDHTDGLWGGTGNDTLRGGAGRDTLGGQSGNDMLFGGTGADRFVFAKGGGADTIADFQNDLDEIRFKNLGNKSAVLSAADQHGADVVFDFGAAGSLTVLDTTLAQVRDDILV